MKISSHQKRQTSHLLTLFKYETSSENIVGYNILRFPCDNVGYSPPVPTSLRPFVRCWKSFAKRSLRLDFDKPEYFFWRREDEKISQKRNHRLDVKPLAKDLILWCSVDILIKMDFTQCKIPSTVAILEWKKWGALGGQGKCRGHHKCLSWMVIFQCFED